jgi:hypothetical protein
MLWADVGASACRLDIAQKGLPLLRLDEEAPHPSPSADGHCVELA